MPLDIFQPRIGVDLGGTKIEAILIDGTGEARARLRAPTPGGDYAATIEAVSNLVKRLCRQAGVSSEAPFGMGTPGAISQKTNLMKNCNSQVLNGRPLLQDLMSHHGAPVRLANDADCFTLSEASDGAGAGAPLVFGVILGTGVGGGICLEGKLLRGANAISGEWGHTTLPLHAYQPDAGDPGRLEPGRRCYCGRYDCVETWLAGPAVERRWVEMGHPALSASGITSRARQGDPAASAFLDHYCNLLALGLSTVINILDPQTIVLGGGLSNTELLYARVPDFLPRYVFSDQVNTSIRRAVHGDSSGVRGAAWLWSNDEIYGPQ